MINQSSKILENYAYIWVDSNINNLENSKYAKDLVKKYPNISFFKQAKDAIKYFKKIKFRITYIIVSGSLFPEFISKLKDAIYEISAAPKIQIFTSESTKQKIKEMSIINDSFYNIGGLVLNFEEVLSFLNKNFFFKKLNFIRPLKRVKMEAGSEFSFKLLNNENDFIGPMYLNRLFQAPEEKQCKHFDEYLIDNYGDIMKELIFQIYNVNCPIPLRIKYWLRAYTLETKFYKDMNSDLMKDKIKPYIPYIQLLYSGLKINNFNFSYTNDLYRGALIEKEEIKDFIKRLEKKNSHMLIYSKAFMSFSLDKNVAMDFMQKKIPTKNTVRVLYIIKTEVLIKEERILIHKNATNADLTDISFFEDEKEILLFPFSIYEISDIQKKDNYYIIYLNILGKYKKNFYFKNSSDLIKSINQSNYIKMLQNNGLLKIVTNFTTIVVHIASLDQLIHLSWVCKITDTISTIEVKLFLKYPVLKNKNFYYLANGILLDKSKTLEENKIKDDGYILICEYPD